MITIIRSTALFLALSLLLTGTFLMTPTVGRSDQEPPRPEILPPPEPGELKPEVLTRGPVHEAFATPTTFDARPGRTVKKAPPPLIQELPPEEKPEGDDVHWMPGYWAWDDGKNDYVWVSGFWRKIPPGREWVAGYWNKLETGEYQWISGFWTKAQSGAIEYLPKPPASLEIGPSTPAPSDEHLWTPGCWVWQSNRYLWQPGFWSPWQDGWIWSPACYTYTPAGYVFVDGFWDYGLDCRGVLFAPCYFGASAYLGGAGWGLGLGWNNWGWGGGWGWGAGWGWGGWFRPRVCIDTGLFLGCLWARPGCGYFFGDYWGWGFGWGGFRPWWNVGGWGSCSLWNYNRCFYNATRPGWCAKQQVMFANRAANPALRPPTTFNRQQLLASRGQAEALAKPVTQVARAANRNQDSAMKFTSMDRDQARQMRQQNGQVQRAAGQRARQEQDVARTSPRGQGEAKQPLTVKRPASPIAARPVQPAPQPGERGRANVGGVGGPGAQNPGATAREPKVPPSTSARNAPPSNLRGGNRTAPPTGGGSAAARTSPGGPPSSALPRGSGGPGGTGGTGGERSGAVLPGGANSRGALPPTGSANRGAPAAAEPRGSFPPPSGGQSRGAFTPPASGNPRGGVAPPSGGGSRGGFSPPSGGGTRGNITPPASGNPRGGVAPPSGGGSRGGFSPPSGGGSRGGGIGPSGGGNRGGSGGAPRGGGSRGGKG